MTSNSELLRARAVAAVSFVLLFVILIGAYYSVKSIKRDTTRLQRVGSDWVLYGVQHPDCPIDTHKLDIMYDEREPNTLVISCTSRDKE